METINIVTAVDNNFVQHLLTMLTSLKKNASEGNHLRVFIIVDDSFKNEYYSLIEGYCSSIELTVELIEFQASVVKDFWVSGHFTLATYYRVYISELLDSSVKRVLYLDSDMIIKGDIFKLWNQDIENNVIAAVRDLASPQMCKMLGIPSQYTYFNAGVLIINLELWRHFELTEKITKYIKNSEYLKFVDQDALNANLFDQVKIIEDCWNAQTNMFTEKLFDATTTTPHIIHYTTPSKPWQVSNIHPLKGEYYKYLKYTPFKGFDPLEEKSKELIASKKYLFIFNAGEIGGNLEQALGGITGFIDNDPQKWGLTKNKLPVYSVEQLFQKYPKNDIGVLIPSIYHKEMGNQLEMKGLLRDIDFIVQY